MGIGYHLTRVMKLALVPGFDQYRTGRPFDDFSAGRLGPAA
ncbi:hypothetical protein P3T23_009182 [Paraburkholderia sp. GAS448]